MSLFNGAEATLSDRRVALSALSRCGGHLVEMLVRSDEQVCA
jgi:hypothetical protein